MKLSSNAQVERQIKSLQLTEGCGFIGVRLFFRSASVSDFSHLQVLIISVPENVSADELSFLLPLLTNIRYCRMENSSHWFHHVLRSLSDSPLQILSMKTIPNGINLCHSFM